MNNRPAGRHALLFIFVTVLINMIGFGIVMPVMPDLIMAVTGEDLSHAARWGGILTVVYAVMQFFASPVLGGLADRLGRRPVILGSLGGYSLDFFIMGIAPHIGLIVAGRVLAGAFAATFATANAYIADVSPPEKRAANFGLMGAAFGLGFIIGPALGGVIGEHFGPRAPFFAAAALGFVNLVYGLFVLPETLPREERRAFEWRRANAFGNFVQLRRYPDLLPIAATILLYQMAHWTFPSVWAYFAGERFSWSAAEIGFSLMAVGLASVIVQGGLTRIVIPRLGEARSAFVGISVTLAACCGYAFATQGWMIYPLIAFSSLGGLTQPSLHGIMSRTMPPNAQGELQGALACINSMTMIVGPLMMTQVFAAFTQPGTSVYFPGAPFMLAAGLLVCGLAPLTAALRRTRGPTILKLLEEPSASAPQPGAR